MMARKPLNSILFSATQSAEDKYVPFVEEQLGMDMQVSIPHEFPRDMSHSLAGLWYCLHLPNTFYELIDLPARVIKNGQSFDLDHRIVVAPIQAFDTAHFGTWQPWIVPAMVVCPDELVEEAERRGRALGFALPPARYSSLNTKSFRSHWRAIHDRLIPDSTCIGHEPSLPVRLDLAPSDLSARWLARQMGFNRNHRFVTAGDIPNLVYEALDQHASLAAISRLESEGATREDAVQRMPETTNEERNRLRIPIVAGLPGVNSAYSRRAYAIEIPYRVRPMPELDAEDTWSSALHERSDVIGGAFCHRVCRRPSSTRARWVRAGHVYQDTERLMTSIADEQGNGVRVRYGLRNPVYVSDEHLDQIVRLDETVRRLEAEDPDVAQIVRLRFYAGLSGEKTASVWASRASRRTVIGPGPGRSSSGNCGRRARKRNTAHGDEHERRSRTNAGYLRPGTSASQARSRSVPERIGGGRWSDAGTDRCHAGCA